MRRRAALAVSLLFLASGALAGGSNYGVAPGTKPLSGKISEWPVPTPKFARDPAPGPDGNIYIAVMQGNRIARFDTKTQKFNEWDLPPGANPHGLLVDKEGKVWYTGKGNGTIGELDPSTGKIKEHKVPSDNSRCSGCPRGTSASARRSSTPKGATGTWARTTGGSALFNKATTHIGET